MRPGGLLAHPAGAGLESMHPFVPLLAFGELGQVASPRCLVFKERVYLELLQEQGWSSASLDRAPRSRWLSSYFSRLRLGAPRGGKRRGALLSHEVIVRSVWERLLDAQNYFKDEKPGHCGNNQEISHFTLPFLKRQHL